MQVGLIGRVRLLIDGEEIDIKRRQLRLVTAVLALHHGELVSQDKLIEALWGDRPPAASLHTLHVYISRLRGLHPEIKEKLITGDSSYGLDVPPDAVDLTRFEVTVDDLRRSDGGSLATARRALSQFQGHLLLGFQYEEFAQAPCRRYRRLRRDLAVIGARLAIEQNADPSDWIDALEGLLEEDVLDEQLWDAVIDCYESQGRLTEANDARWRRNREFGQLSSVEPRPWPLVGFRGGLENRILIGRENETADLVQALSDTRLVSVVGPPGVGKTHLAYHLSLLQAEPVRWIAFDKAASAIEALSSGLDIEALPSALRSEQLAESIRFSGGLVVLDNCEIFTEDVVRFVTSCLATFELARFLVTSRRPLGVPGERVYRLEGLDVSEAGAGALSDGAELLSIYAGRDSFDVSSLNEMAERLDGVPLALQLAGGLASRLGAERARMLIEDADLLATQRIVRPESEDASIADSVERSVAALDEAESLVFRRAAWISAEFGFDDLEEITPELDSRTLLHALDSLVGQSLVKREGNTYSIMWALASAARARSPDPVFDRAVHAQWLRDRVQRIAPRTLGAQALEAHKELSQLGRDIKDALDYAMQHEPDIAVELSGNLGWHWHCRGEWSLLEPLVAQIFEYSTSSELDARLGALWTHMIIQFDLRNVAAALEVAERGVEESKLSANAKEYRVVFEAMGAAAHSTTGDFESGLEAARRARTEAEEIDSAWPTAIALFSEASLHLNRETHQLAIEACGKILALRDCDPLLWSAAAFVLARDRRRRGELEAAKRLTNESMKILSQIGEPFFRTMSKLEQALIHLHEDQPLEAGRILTEAMRQSLVRKDPMETVPCLRALSVASLAHGNEELAVTLDAAAELRNRRAPWEINPWDLPELSVSLASVTISDSEDDTAVLRRSAEALTDREIVERCEAELPMTARPKGRRPRP